MLERARGLAEKNVLFCRVFRRAGVGLALVCGRAEAGTLATPQPQGDPQASTKLCFPGSDARVLGPRAEGAGRREGPRKADSGWPAGAAPSPITWAWWVGTDVKLEKSLAIQLRSAPPVLRSRGFGR